MNLFAVNPKATVIVVFLSKWMLCTMKACTIRFWDGSDSVVFPNACGWTRITECI